MYQQRQLSPVQIRLLVSGMGAVALLWLAVLWQTLAVSSWSMAVDEPPHVAVAADALPYASSEQNFSPRRTNPFFSSIPQDDDYFPFAWPLVATVFALTVILNSAFQFVLHRIFSARWLQLQTLNISRAPPTATPFIF